MSFEKPPSLNDNFDATPEPTRDTAPRQRRVRMLTISLSVLVLVLFTINLWQSDLSAVVRGTGTVRGVALDFNGLPFSGNIYVEGTKLIGHTGTDGSFELKNVPAGKHLVVVADGYSGREFPALVTAGQVTDIGQVVFKSTATP